MLKTLLLSGWFRVQPFLRYVLIVMVIAPAVAASSHAASVNNYSSMAVGRHDEGFASVQNEGADFAHLGAGENTSPTNSNTGNLSGDNSGNNSKNLSGEPSSQGVGEEGMIAVVEPGLLQAYVGGSSLPTQLQGGETVTSDSLNHVEFAPLPSDKSLGSSENTPQADLIARLKAAKGQGDNEFSHAFANGDRVYFAKVQPGLRHNDPILDKTPVMEAPQPDQKQSEDPLGSAYPVPMKWIMATQEEIGTRGGGTRYYRSHPVISPDGRYAVYSRIQLEVKPEMHNTRVSSVLFIEDRQTKRLRIVTSTSRNRDALVPVQIAQDENGDGTIGVLVPVSWSQKGDRFLARRFEGVMNTSDASDSAVIWNREKDYTRTVTPVKHQAEQEHEQVAILLGWSKSQPDRVLFRTGEFGSEDWPVVSVSDDGNATRASEVDQPVTYREVSQVWAGPQVAYR